MTKKMRNRMRRRPQHPRTHERRMHQRQLSHSNILQRPLVRPSPLTPAQHLPFNASRNLLNSRQGTKPTSIQRLAQSNKRKKVAMRPMPNQRPRWNINRPIPILPIPKPTLKRISTIRHEKVIRRDSRNSRRNSIVNAMDNRTGQRRIGILADQEILLDIRGWRRPAQRGEMARAVGGQIDREWRPGRAHVGTLEGDGGRGMLGECGAFGEELCVAPFGAGE